MFEQESPSSRFRTLAMFDSGLKLASVNATLDPARLEVRRAIDLCSYGLYSYGLYSYGLIVMAYIVMAYIVMACTVIACTVIAYIVMVCC